MTRTCTYCGETSPASLANCPSCGRSFATGQVEHVMTPPRGVSVETGPDAGALYTRLALRAVDLSDTFNALFTQPMPGWRIEMGRPGMSTAGGRQSLQHIGLRGPNGGTIVVGSVDPGAQRAEVRSYRRLDAMFRERYKRGIPIRAADWDRFVQRIVQFLDEEGLTVSVESGAGFAARDEDTDDFMAPSRGPTSLWVIVAVLGVALLAGAVTWFLMTRPAPPPAPSWMTPGSAPAVPAPPPWPTPAPPSAP